MHTLRSRRTQFGHDGANSSRGQEVLDDLDAFLYGSAESGQGRYLHDHAPAHADHEEFPACHFRRDGTNSYIVLDGIRRYRMYLQSNGRELGQELYRAGPSCVRLRPYQDGPILRGYDLNDYNGHSVCHTTSPDSMEDSVGPEDQTAS